MSKILQYLIIVFRRNCAQTGGRGPKPSRGESFKGFLLRTDCKVVINLDYDVMAGRGNNSHAFSTFVPL